MHNGVEIKKETFLTFNERQRSEVLYDFMDHIVKELNYMKKKSLVNKFWSAAGGVVGGGLAYLGINVRF